MQVTTSIMLMCAVLMSLAAGVLLAYGVCMAMFQIFRIHARQVQARNSIALTLPVTLEN